MSATNTFEGNLLALIFQNTDCPNVGDATGLRGSATAGSFYVSLATASPGETGTQSTSEAAYTGYARVAVARSSAEWSVASSVASNVNAVSFPTCTSGSAVVTHFGIGSASTGAGNLFLYGTLTASLNISSGITPQFAAGNIDVSLD